MELNAEALARAILDDAPYDDLVRQVRESPERSRAVLEELSGNRDPVIRAWVPSVARAVLGKEALSIILRLARDDPDVDVRDVATEELLELDRAAAQSLAPLFRKKLQSSDHFEPLTAMWALGAIGDRESIELIQGKIAGRQPDALDRITGKVVIMLLTDPPEILRRIREHDHDHMLWLARAAALLHTREALAALEACVDGAPDARCREQCSEQLKRVRERTRER